MDRISKFFFKTFIRFPLLNRYSLTWYKLLGVEVERQCRIASDLKIAGHYSFLKMRRNAEINQGCFLLAKDEIRIGENSTLAYQVTILTSANPNGPKNRLAKLYKPIKAPVTIGDNVWIGARAIILPGVSIGDCSVVAAGSVVTKNVPSFVVVAGIPAKVVKQLDEKMLFKDI